MVDFHHLELHGLAHENVVVAYGVNVNLAAGQEGFDTEYIDNHAALCAALDEALNDIFVLESCIDALPALAQTSLLVREHQLSLLVFGVLDIHFYCVAHFEVRIVAELAGGDDAVALVTDVHNHFLLVNANNLAVNNLMVSNLVQGLVISLLKVFFADVHTCAILKFFPIEVFQWLYVL